MRVTLSKGRPATNYREAKRPDGAVLLHLDESAVVDSNGVFEANIEGVASGMSSTGPASLPRVEAPGARVIDETWSASVEPELSVRPIQAQASPGSPDRTPPSRAAPPGRSGGVISTLKLPRRSCDRRFLPRAECERSLARGSVLPSPSIALKFNSTAPESRSVPSSSRLRTRFEAKSWRERSCGNPANVPCGSSP